MTIFVSVDPPIIAPNYMINVSNENKHHNFPHFLDLYMSKCMNVSQEWRIFNRTQYVLLYNL